MSLDKFMAKHMSEDNASFKEILDGINKRRREKYAWVHGLNRENEVIITAMIKAACCEASCDADTAKR